MAKYTDKQINDFLGLAQEVGITKAMRELGYPSSWATGQYWAEKRGVDVSADEIKQRAAATREWYKDEEMVTIAQEGLNRVYQDLMTKKDLSADDQKKLASAYTSYVKDILTIQGRSSHISETRSGDVMDEHIMNLLFTERERNQEKKEEGQTIVSQLVDMS